MVAGEYNGSISQINALQQLANESRKLLQNSARGCKVLLMSELVCNEIFVEREAILGGYRGATASPRSITTWLVKSW